MRRLAILVVAALAAVTVGASCGPKKLNVGQLDKKEWVVLAVGVNNAGKCALREKQVSEIRTEAKSQVNWIVVGHCPAVEGKQQTIAIDPKFKKGSEEYDPFKSEGSVLSAPIPTEPNQFVHLKGLTLDQIPENRKGLYKYKIRINDAVAEWKSFADDGDFFLCPVWPCGDFEY